MKLPKNITAPENLFVLLAVVFGLIFMIVTPALQPPDERNHFARAFVISEGGFVSHRYPSGDVGSDIPKNLLTTDLCILLDTPYNRSNPDMFGMLIERTKTFGVESDPFAPGKNRDWRRVALSLFSIPLEALERVTVRYPNVALYSPLAYAPQSAAIALGKLAGLPPIAFLYLARAVGLLLYILAVRWAIMVMPKMKWVMFAVALTPTALFQASSLSTDTMTNSAAFLMFALVMREALRESVEPLSKTALWAIAICTALVTHLKFYLFVPLLVLIIPMQRGRMKTFILALVLSAMLVGTWSYLIRDLYVPLTPEVSPSRQLAYIAEHPGAFIEAFFHTVSERTGLLITQFAGKFSHYHLYLPQWFAFLHIAALIAIARMEGISINRYQRIVSGAVFFLSMGLLYFLNYLTGTPVGSQINIGVQGRYIYPVLLPALMMIAPLRDAGFMGRKVGFIIGTYSAALLIVSVSTIYRGYYG